MPISPDDVFTLSDDTRDTITSILGSDALPFISAVRRASPESINSIITHDLGLNCPPQVRQELIALNQHATTRRLSMHTVAITEHMPKNRMYAVLWLAGASWGQISKLFGIQRSSACSTAEHILRTVDRQAHRIEQSPISMDFVTYLRKHYYSLPTVYHFIGDILSIAKVVHERAMIDYQYSEATNDAYEGLPQLSDTNEPSTEELTQAEIAQAAQELEANQRAATNLVRTARVAALLPEATPPEPPPPLVIDHATDPYNPKNWGKPPQGDV